MKVSLIVPFYGVEKYIAECAESVLSQTYPDIEFIFVDDGSTDRSLEILNNLIDNKFSSKKSQISIIRKSNGGLPQARKTGLNVASGEYIMHVDSDDWIDTDAVEKLVSKVEGTGADVVYYYVAKEKSGGRTHIAKDPEYSDPKVFSNDILHYRAHGYLCNKFMKRSLYTDDLFYLLFFLPSSFFMQKKQCFYRSLYIITEGTILPLLQEESEEIAILRLLGIFSLFTSSIRTTFHPLLSRLHGNILSEGRRRLPLNTTRHYSRSILIWLRKPVWSIAYAKEYSVSNCLYSLCFFSLMSISADGREIFFAVSAVSGYLLKR